MHTLKGIVVILVKIFRNGVASALSKKSSIVAKTTMTVDVCSLQDKEITSRNNVEKKVAKKVNNEAMRLEMEMNETNVSRIARKTPGEAPDKPFVDMSSFFQNLSVG